MRASRHAAASIGRARPVGPQRTVPGRLFGLRTWSVTVDDNGALRLGSRGRRWRNNGESTWAECDAGGRGAALHPRGTGTPAGNCTCGLYHLHPCTASDSPFWQPDPKDGPPVVIGVCEAWGRVHLHSEGFRAQYARPIAFAVIARSRDSDYGRLVEDLAISHRAEVLELLTAAELIEHCRVAGQGMTPEAIRALLTAREPGTVRVDQEPSLERDVLVGRLAGAACMKPGRAPSAVARLSFLAVTQT